MCAWRATSAAGSALTLSRYGKKQPGKDTFSEDGGYIRACSGGNRTAAMGAALGILRHFREDITTCGANIHFNQKQRIKFEKSAELW